MLSYVCDRCRKIISSTDTRKMVRLQFRNDSADRNVDLCSKCFGLFDEFILNGKHDDTDEPVAMSLDEDWFKCPRCHAHYAFNVTDEVVTSDLDASIQIRRIHVLRRTPNNVIEDGYINQPFVNFHCSMCNQLLSVPENVLKEVNK